MSDVLNNTAVPILQDSEKASAYFTMVVPDSTDPTLARPRKILFSEVEHQGDILNGRASEPTSTAENVNDLLIGTGDIIKKVEVRHEGQTNAAGTWNPYTTIPVYRRHPDLNHLSSGDIYYVSSLNQFFRVVLNPWGGQNEASHISPQTALGANSVWLSKKQDGYDATTAITNFNAARHYYAEFADALFRLDNSTYTAATQGTLTYQWTPVNSDERIQLRTLIDNIRQVPEFPSEAY